MKKLVLLCALLLPLAWAQEKREAAKKPNPEPRVARVFTIKSGDPERIALALRVVGINATVERRLNMIVVSGEPSLMQSAAEIVQKLDQPAPPTRNVEVTLYIVEAGAKATGQEGRMPPALAPVLKQVGDMFGYTIFTLFDAPVLRGREDQDVITYGILASPPTAPSGRVEPGRMPQSGYNIRFRPSVSTGPQARTIRLQDFRFDLKAPGDFGQAVINSDLDLREGQMVVIGKTGIAGPDRALVVVASGRIIE